MLQCVGGVDGGSQLCLCLDISCSSRRFRLGRFEEWTIAVSVYGRKLVSTTPSLVHSHCLVDQDTEEGGRLFVWVWPELRVDLDDECGSHRGEQTGLLSDQ